MEIFVETIERELPDLAAPGRARRASSAGATGPPTRCGRRWPSSSRRRTATSGSSSGSRSTTAAARRSSRRRGGSSRRASIRATSTRTRSASRLYAPEMPEPDLLIRTSGELRVSNFLLWQLAYTELVFVDTLWPDFGERELRAARSPSTRAAAAASAADDARCLSRVAVVAAGAADRLGGAYLGGWFLFALARSRRWSRCTSSTALARDAAPARPRGLRRARSPRCSARELGGLAWMLGGFLVTFLLAFVFAAVSETRQSTTVAIATTVFGAAWIGLGLGHLILLRELDAGRHGRDLRRPDHGLRHRHVRVRRRPARGPAQDVAGRSRRGRPGRASSSGAVAGVVRPRSSSSTTTAPRRLALARLRRGRRARRRRSATCSSRSSSATSASRTRAASCSATAASSTASTRSSSPAPAAYFTLAGARRSGLDGTLDCPTLDDEDASRCSAPPDRSAVRRSRSIDAHPELELCAALGSRHEADSIAAAARRRARPGRAAT